MGKSKHDPVATATIIAAILAGVLGIIGVVIGVILPRLIDSTPTPQVMIAPLEITQQVIVQRVTDTPTAEPIVQPTIVPIPTDTLDVVLIVATLDAQATTDQATLFAQETIAERVTAYARATHDSINASATATLWTNTPTPNVTASIEAYRTHQAATATQSWIDSWTDTPIPTVAPIPLGFTGNPVTENDQWGLVTQDFDGVAMVLVPTGCFMMGSDTGDADERPVHEQCFDDPFWIDQTEVTQANFVRLGGTKAVGNYFNGDNRPVENISWFEARDFCELRGARLPTEREWEYAARGPSNLVYSWGNDWLVINWAWNRDSSLQTADVGSSTETGQSWVGAYDMIGNVLEWGSSLYSPYPYNYYYEDSNYDEGPRMVRGGSRNNSGPNYLRAAYRNWHSPEARVNYLGFRCALSSETEENF